MLERFRDFFKRPDNLTTQARKLAKELPEFKEDWKSNFGGITISGHSATGKTYLAEIIATIYRIPEDRNVKIGQIIRKLMDKEDAIDFIDRTPDIDSQVDRLSQDLVENSSLEKPFILEARRAGEIGSKYGDSSIIKVLLTVNKENRDKRLLGKRPNFSVEEIDEKESNRARRDLERWRSNDINFIGDPYDPKNFDLIIDTSDKTREEVFRILHRFLIFKGYISNNLAETPTQESVPPSGMVFEGKNPPQPPVI